MPPRRFLLPIAVSALIATPASGDVVDAAPGGFSVRNEISLPVRREEAWATFVGAIGRWWNPDHTISGNAAALLLDPRPLGCFCEVLGAGSGMVHMTVTLVTPPGMLRLTGGLGPLGLGGMSGNLTVEFQSTDAGTDVVLRYAVGGYHPDGLDSMAPAVDRVLDDALARFARYLGTGSPVAEPDPS